jgi:hypothetical protein
MVFERVENIVHEMSSNDGFVSWLYALVISVSKKTKPNP